MKYAILILMLCIAATLTFAQESDTIQKKTGEEKGKLLESLNLDSLNLNIKVPAPQLQEEVKVEADDYPGLDVSVESPAASMGGYKPYTRQELQAYSDLITDYKLTSYNTTGTARPQKPSRLFQAGVPD